MIMTAHKLRQQTTTSAAPLLLLGLVAVVMHNWRLWQRERALADRLRAERAAALVLAHTPPVSALVAAWNEREQIDAHIQSFLALDYPDIELVLCAGGSDTTFDRACRYASERVKVLEQQPGEGKQRALARCLAHATGDIIYLTDADCRFSDDALRRLLAPLVNEGECAATGDSRPLDCQAGKLLPSYIWAADVASSARKPRYVQGLLGRNAALSRAAVAQIGGLDFPARTGTDYHLARRLNEAGIAIRHVSASVVASAYPETFSVYRRKQSRWLRNLLMHGPRYHAWRDVFTTLRTSLIGVIMLVAPLVSAVACGAVLVPWALLLAHAWLSKLRYLLFASRVDRRPVQGRTLLGGVPMVFLDFVAWALPLFDVLRAQRRHQW